MNILYLGGYKVKDIRFGNIITPIRICFNNELIWIDPSFIGTGGDGAR